MYNWCYSSGYTVYMLLMHIAGTQYYMDYKLIEELFT